MQIGGYPDNQSDLVSFQVRAASVEMRYPAGATYRHVVQLFVHLIEYTSRTTDHNLQWQKWVAFLNRDSFPSFDPNLKLTCDRVCADVTLVDLRL